MPLKRGGRVVVGFGEPGPRPVIDDNATARDGAPSAAFDLTAAGAKPLVDEACPGGALARR